MVSVSTAVVVAGPSQCLESFFSKPRPPYMHSIVKNLPVVAMGLTADRLSGHRRKSLRHSSGCKSEKTENGSASKHFDNLFVEKYEV